MNLRELAPLFETLGAPVSKAICKLHILKDIMTDWWVPIGWLVCPYIQFRSLVATSTLPLRRNAAREVATLECRWSPATTRKTEDATTVPFNGEVSVVVLSNAQLFVRPLLFVVVVTPFKST